MKMYGTRRGQSPWINPARPDDQVEDVGADSLLDLLGGLSGRNLGFALSLQPLREQMVFDMLEAGSPARDRETARLAQEELLGSAATTGRRSASRLRSLGFGRSAQAGAELDARNRALQAGHDNLLRLLNPASRLSRLASLLGVLDGQSFSPALGARLQGTQMKWAKDADDDARRGSLVGDLLGFGAMLGPDLIELGRPRSGGRRS